MRNSFDPIDIIKIIIFIVLVAGLAGVFVYMHVEGIPVNIPFISGMKDSHEHKSGTWVTQDEATCTENGYRYQVCSECNVKFNGEVVPALGHDSAEPVKENVVEASCITGGSYDEISYCSRCDEVVSTKHVIVEIHKHKAAAAVIENEVAPTCTTNGSYDSVVYCRECDAEVSRDEVEVPALGHTATELVTKVTDPTCTVDGSNDVVSICLVCEAEYVVSSTPITAIGHTPSSAVTENEKPATCQAPGSYDSVIYCATCGGELQRKANTIPVGDHIPADAVQENVNAPTCTQHGTYDNVVYCSVCDLELLRTVGVSSAIGHNYVGELTYNEESGKFELAISCANEGVVVTVIDSFTSDELTSEVTTEPDCTNEGVRVYTAAVVYNGYTVSAELAVVEPATDHTLIAYDKDGNPYNVITTAYKIDGEGNVTYGYLYDDELDKLYYLVSTPGIAASIDSSNGETYNTIWDENGFALGVYKCAKGGEWRTVFIYDANFDTRLA